MATVVFDPARFKEAYPAFSNVDDPVLQSCFDQACLYLSPTDCPVQNEQKREQLLWMLTAHIAELRGVANPGGTPASVGRVSSATEGSTSISFDYQSSQNAAWFNQTQAGAAFWQATASLRAFRYFARPTRIEGLYGRPWR